MNKIMMAALSAALLCGTAGAAMAAPAADPSQAQLQAEVTTLQAEVAALQAVSNVQPACGPGAMIPTGG